jgi:hypothetical protein
MTAETNANGIPLAQGLPRDGGFGQFFLADFRSFGNAVPILPIGLEGFNSPPVVESADTAPFFHNHAVADLESAVAFYGTVAFQNSIFGPVIPVSISEVATDPEVQAIAAFLRVLNALENIRSSINVAERGATMTSAEDKRELAGLTLAETIDAMQVLSEGALATDISLPFDRRGSNCSTPGWRSMRRGSCRFRTRLITFLLWPYSNSVRRDRRLPIRPPCRLRSVIEGHAPRHRHPLCDEVSGRGRGPAYCHHHTARDRLSRGTRTTANGSIGQDRRVEADALLSTRRAVIALNDAPD